MHQREGESPIYKMALATSVGSSKHAETQLFSITDITIVISNLKLFQ